MMQQGWDVISGGENENHSLNKFPPSYQTLYLVAGYKDKAMKLDRFEITDFLINHKNLFFLSIII